MSDSIRGSLEENIITLLVWNDNHAPILASILTHGIFGDRVHQRIAEVSIEYINRFHQAPKVHLKDLLERELRRPDSTSTYIMSVLKAMEDLQKDIQADYVISELDKFIRIRRRIMSIDNALSALQTGDEAKAENALWEHAPAAASRLTEGLWLHDTNLDFMVTEKDEDYFSSGVDALDKRDVRPARGTVVLFIAPRKRGKSWSCTNVGKANMRYRKKVLHITMENSEKLTKRRYVQALWAMTRRQAETAIDVPYFERKQDTDEWIGNMYQNFMPLAMTETNSEIITERLTQLQTRPPLLIKQFPTGSLTIAQLNAYLDNLDRKYHFVPDLVIVDSPDNMHIDPRNLRIDTGRMLVNLRGVAVERDFAMYATTQGNRESDEAKWVKSKMVAEDWSKAGTADLILTYSRTPQEYARGFARILVDASRDSDDGFAVMITQSYKIGQFCVDSILMQGAVSEESERIINPGRERTEEDDT